MFLSVFTSSLFKWALFQELLRKVALVEVSQCKRTRSWSMERSSEEPKSFATSRRINPSSWRNDVWRTWWRNILSLLASQLSSMWRRARKRRSLIVRMKVRKRRRKKVMSQRLKMLGELVIPSPLNFFRPFPPFFFLGKVDPKEKLDKNSCFPPVVPSGSRWGEGEGGQGEEGETF